MWKQKKQQLTFNVWGEQQLPRRSPFGLSRQENFVQEKVVLPATFSLCIIRYMFLIMLENKLKNVTQRESGLSVQGQDCV